MNLHADSFEYDGELASDYNLIACSIDGSSDDTVSIGAELNFNQVPIRHGSYWATTDTTYDNALEAAFQVCKFDCETGIQELTLEDERRITRWLNRKEPHVLKLINNNEIIEEYMFEGSFNLQLLYLGGIPVGYELHFISNRPFAIGQTVVETIEATTNDFVYELNDMSDEVGFIYPSKITIAMKSSGTLDLINYNENTAGRITQIKNCVDGEIITFDDVLTLSTDNTEHSKTIQDDFNYRFFRISNSYNNSLNRILVSLPCDIEIEYKPIVKGVGL